MQNAVKEYEESMIYEMTTYDAGRATPFRETQRAEERAVRLHMDDNEHMRGDYPYGRTLAGRHACPVHRRVRRFRFEMYQKTAMCSERSGKIEAETGRVGSKEGACSNARGELVDA